jgi:hypothetical protein
MRTALCLSMALMAAPCAQGQATPEALLALVPPAPVQVCAARPAEREAFQARLRGLIAAMDARIDQKRAKDEAASEASGKALEARMTAKAPSQKELDRVETLSDAEKIKWAMAQMGNQDPAAMRELAVRGQGAQQALAANKEGKARLDRLTRAKAKYEALDAEYRALIGGGGQDFTSRMRNVPPALCPQLTAKYQSLLAEQLTALKAALPDYQRMAEASAQAAGLPKGAAASTEAMSEVRDYAFRLMEIHKFNTSPD